MYAIEFDVLHTDNSMCTFQENHEISCQWKKKILLYDVDMCYKYSVKCCVFVRFQEKCFHKSLGNKRDYKVMTTLPQEMYKNTRSHGLV